MSSHSFVNADEPYPHEAGEFIRRNLRDFPSPLPAELFNTLARPKEIHYIAAPTENAQARYLPAKLDKARKGNCYCPL